MQNKLQEYENYVNALQENAAVYDETGEATEDADENEQAKHQKAPRLFCDICDEFDLHDTEDCPQQAMITKDVNSHSRHNVDKSSNRAYCDNCEAFGHDTSDCTNKKPSDDDQMF